MIHDNDFGHPETPREFAMLDKIKMLERRIGYEQAGVMTEIRDEPASFISPECTKMLQVAKMTAWRTWNDSWRFDAIGYSKVRGSDYQLGYYVPHDDYCDRDFGDVLIDMHHRLIRMIGRDRFNPEGA
ncbi:hypothetical protein KAJ83_01690 [Marivibrio halodurans]|uniref:Uncharacterized protein n=1 Tax=Marivibrio halodurans TaxID=2039722 RepID=A0A8J7V0W1_9PROT|nr:hypothetical protein [Marivibrio halodurans]MBP5855705.1 hypothetical protein [Marivibrio halodurans]